MDLSVRIGAEGEDSLEVVWEDGEFLLRRARLDIDGERREVLTLLPAAEHPTPATLDRFAHEYALKDKLDVAWAARPDLGVLAREAVSIPIRNPDYLYLVAANIGAVPAIVTMSTSKPSSLK